MTVGYKIKNHDWSFLLIKFHFCNSWNKYSCKYLTLYGGALNAFPKENCNYDPKINLYWVEKIWLFPIVYKVSETQKKYSFFKIKTCILPIFFVLVKTFAFAMFIFLQIYILETPEILTMLLLCYAKLCIKS